MKKERIWRMVESFPDFDGILCMTDGGEQDMSGERLRLYP